jgi:AraC-like DNA-binding protein
MVTPSREGSPRTTPDGFGYRIVCVEPAHIHEAARAIRGRPCALPFVREPVTANNSLRSAIEEAFRLDPDPLAIDGLILTLAEALLDADASCDGCTRPAPLDGSALARARQFLDVETTRVIRSSELEEVTGLTRYDLARQFRSAFGASSYRYSLMRWFDRARAQMRRNRSLADVALAAGFPDQAHLSRMFKYAFGATPARYRAPEADRAGKVWLFEPRDAGRRSPKCVLPKAGSCHGLLLSGVDRGRDF